MLYWRTLVRYYNRDGKPIPFEQWVALFERGDDYRIVRQTTIGPWWVSTVWLGLNHNWGGGPPLIFETMVFWEKPDDDYRDITGLRYSTLAQARSGHARFVWELRRKARTIQGALARSGLPVTLLTSHRDEG